MRWMRYTVFAFALLMAAGLCQNLSAQFLGWNYVDIVTDVRQGGQQPDMVVAADGTFHICYWVQEEDKLVYAYRNAGASTWTREYIDTGHANGFRSSLALDTLGVPHIAYYENDNGFAQLRMARRTAPNTWAIETIPGEHGRGWGAYGNNAVITSKERLKHSIDLLFDESNEAKIIFFDAWMEEDAFPTCTAVSEYGLRMVQAYKKLGQWYTKDFGKVDDIYQSCGTGQDPINLPNGDRYGEYCKIVQRADNSLQAFATSRFNNRIINFTTTVNDTIWAQSEVDSMPRNLDPAAWGWTQRFYSFEGLSAAVAPDDIVHLAYTSSIFYGENFCCTQWTNDLVYAQIQADTTYYFNFGPSTYRNYTDVLAHGGSDSLYMVYADLNKFEFYLQESADSGKSWVQDTIRQGLGTSAMHLAIVDTMIHVLYHDAESGSLLLSSRALSGGDWVHEQVTRSENRGASLDGLVQTINGDTVWHLAYTDNQADKIYYTTGSLNNNWAWQTSDLDSLGSYAAVSIDLGPSGQPVLTYAAGDGHGLRYAEGGATWNFSVIDSFANVSFTDMVISDADTVHIMFFDDTQNCLRYARRHFADTVWTMEYVDCGNAPVGQFPSLVVDANDKVSVAYFDDFYGYLRFAERDPQTRAWNIEAVDSAIASKVGKFCHLQTYSNGDPVIAYLDERNAIVKLAERNQAGLWDIEIIDSTAVTGLGRPISMSIDQFDNPWVAYNFYSNFEKVKLARRDTIWNEVGVPNTGQIANEFHFQIVGGDLYLAGKKNALQNNGLAMIYSPEGLYVETDPTYVFDRTVELTVYPNPFVGQATFAIELDVPRKLTLEVYDVFGRKTHTIFAERPFTAGRHSQSFEGSQLPAGIYYAILSDGQGRQVKKLVVGR